MTDAASTLPNAIVAPAAWDHTWRFRRADATLALAVLALAGSLAAANPARAAGNDGVVTQFFSIWDDNAKVTPDTVRALYARRVVYYGEAMTADGVYANKMRFIHRWPDRHYAVVPGTVSKGCAPGQARCTVSTVLRWSAQSAARGAAAGGYTRVTLDLVRQDGELRIARESGRPVPAP